MQAIRVWDPLVRTFHWSLAAACLLNLFILEDGSNWHRWLGYYAAGAVIFRVLWGFVGSPHARFRNFFPTPTRLRVYLQELRRGNHPDHLGHNPLGSLMILTLMGLVLALGVSGWMMGLDAYWGEDWLEHLHEFFGDCLMVLVFIHVAAVSLYSRFSNDNLIRAMITGDKQRP